MAQARFKAAIFDLDGTLVDSMGYWLDLVENFLNPYDLYPDEEAKAAVAKMSLYQAAVYLKNRYSMKGTVEEIHKALKKETKAIYTQRCRLKPGVREYLEELKRQRIPMALATMADKKSAKKALSRLGIKGFFSFVMTDEDVGKSKTSPELYLAVAEKLKTEPRDCAVFEDGVIYGTVAKEAGFLVYAVKDPGNRERYEAFAAAVDGEAPWQ